MTFLFEPINAGLAPNTQKVDAWEAAKLLTQPWKWRGGEARTKLKKWLGERFSGRVYLFASGREALWALFESLDLDPGDEILIQAFTCAAVPNAVKWAGLRPVFVDIDPRTYNLDPADLEEKITPRSRVVVVQHTFGIPADLEAVRRVSKKHGLLLIEDCAQALGSREREGWLGSFGDAAVFSFGRDKPFSGVWGGALICRLARAAQRLEERPIPPPRRWIGQQLLHPVLFLTFILPWYRLEVGKVFLVLLQKLRLLSLPINNEERSGGCPWPAPRALANALARLTLTQLERFDEFCRHRQKLARIYEEELKDVAEIDFPDWNLDGHVPLRFPVWAARAAALSRRLKKQGILLGRWYACVVDPAGVDWESVGYRRGICPEAEKASQGIINLPCSPRTSGKDALRVCRLIKDFYSGSYYEIGSSSHSR